MQVVPAANVAASTLDDPGTRHSSRHSHRRRPPAGLARLVTVLVVVGVTGFVFAELRPDLLFGPNLDVGGDNAGHVVAVYYYIHHLLPSGQLSGWDPQWDGGFPLYVFYFPLPAVLTGLLTVPLSFAVAFKLVTVLGSLLLPSAAYTFGRLAGLRRPVPELMCVATVPYLLNTSYTIDGGNFASTMAGEFSYSLALSLALFFLGVFAYALRTGRLRWLAAILFAATIFSHVVPALFAGAAAVVIAFAHFNRRSMRVLFTVLLAGGLLAAVWLVPFAVYLHEGFTSSMNYGRVTQFTANLFPATGMLVVIALAFIGAAFAIVRRDRLMLAVSGAAALAALGFRFLPSGLVYNPRWLPLWFLAACLVAAYGTAELFRVALNAAWWSHLHSVVTPIVVSAVVVLLAASWSGSLPFLNFPAGKQNFATTSWIPFNYSGYQAKPGWSEFSNLVTMLERSAKQHGCGLLDYEYSPNISNWYGSTLAPMSLPLWTNGCIDTTEGLYYESSTTTDFHFLDQSELSLNASNPVGGLPYQPTNVADGIAHLQLMGVRYFLANSPQVEAAAKRIPALTEVGSAPAGPLAIDAPTYAPASTSGHWILYLIRGAQTVAPLRYEPVVESSLSPTAFRSLAITWYQNRRYWPVPIARSGPSSWRREPAGTLVSPSAATRVKPTRVYDVVEKDASISFHVTRLGSPVVVRIPDFPNWQTSGASGPYFVTPNLMVVIPHSHLVTLRYGTTTVDWIGRAGTGLGLVGTLSLAFLPWRRRDDDPTGRPDEGGDGGEGSPTGPMVEPSPNLISDSDGSGFEGTPE